MQHLSRRSANLLCKTVSTNNQNAIRLSHDEVKPKKWQRWQDVPDEWVLPSKRMPDNPIYTTKTWKRFKKNQIFSQQNDGTPVWLSRGYPYNFLYWIAGALLIYCGYAAFSNMLDGAIYPKKKQA